MAEPRWVTQLKTKWNIKSNWDFILIMVVFSLAGMGIVYLRPPIFHLLGIRAETPFWIKTCVYIPLIFPLYQVSLLFWGLVLGQFGFFWEKEKQMVKFLKQKLSRS